MPTLQTIRKTYKVSGNLAEADSVSASDATAEWGVKRSDNHRVVVADGQDFEDVIDGIYELTWVEPQYGVGYDYSIEIVDSSESIDKFVTGSIAFNGQWVSDTKADTYFGGRAAASSYWVSGVGKDEYLKEAQRQIALASENPRHNWLIPVPVTELDENDSASTADPEEALIQAVCEQALFLIQQGDALEKRGGIIAQGVTRSEVVGETYKSWGLDTQPICQRAVDALRQYKMENDISVNMVR